MKVYDDFLSTSEGQKYKKALLDLAKAKDNYLNSAELNIDVWKTFKALEAKELRLRKLYVLPNPNLKYWELISYIK